MSYFVARNRIRYLAKLLAKKKDRGIKRNYININNNKVFEGIEAKTLLTRKVKGGNKQSWSNY